MICHDKSLPYACMHDMKDLDLDLDPFFFFLSSFVFLISHHLTLEPHPFEEGGRWKVRKVEGKEGGR